MKKSIWGVSSLQKVGAILNIFALVAILFSPFLVNVPTASAATLGPNSGGTFSSTGFSGSTISWINPSRAQNSDNSYATATIPSSGQVTDYLKVSNFGFSIPASSTIDGIQVSIERSATCVSSCSSDIFDNIVRLVKNGTVSGTDYAKTSSTWAWPSSDASTTYGGATNKWGNTWTSTDINSSTFGVVLSVGRDTGGDKVAKVDQILVTVYYTASVLASTTTSVNCPNVNFGSSTTCTAKVTRVSGSNTPSGSVTFSTGASGSFTPSTSCTLSGSGASSTCSVTYTPSTFNGGSHLITANYGGDSNFSTSSGNVSLTVNDVTPPVFGVISNITQEATGPTGAAVSFSVSATDNVDGSVSSSMIVCSPSSGSLFALGTSTVSCTATDTHSNAATTSFSVAVRDTTPPSISLNGSSSINLYTGGSYTEYGATASDLVSGDLTGGIITTIIPGGSVNTSATGTYTVTYSVSDGAGNAASTTRMVYVSDMTAPVIDPFADITTEATGPTGATVSFGPLTATDDVDASSSLSVGCTPSSGSTFAVGTTTVSCSVTDSSTNTGYLSFKVAVTDTTAPTLTLNGAASTTLIIGDTYTELGATFMDLVDTSGTVVIGGDVVPAGPLTTGAVYNVTYNATDSHGNAATQLTRTVTVTNSATTTLTVSFGSTPSGYGASVTVNSTTATYTAPVVLNNTEIFNATATPVIGFAVMQTGTCSGTATAGGPYVCEFNYTSSSFDITASAGSNGSISPSGVTSVPQGGSQAFTITPDSGFQVSDVLVDGSSVGGVTTYTFSSVMASHTIAASFSAIPPTPPSGGGGGGGGGSVTFVPSTNPGAGGNTGGGTTGGGTTGGNTGGGATGGSGGNGSTGGNTGNGTGSNTGGGAQGGNTPTGGGTTGGNTGGGATGGNGGGATGGSLTGGPTTQGATGTLASGTSTESTSTTSTSTQNTSLLASILSGLGGNMNLWILLLAILGIMGLIYYFSRD